jgi:hypothetical protein
MRLRDWFILVAVVFATLQLWAMWSQYCYERGYAAGAEQAAFDA